MKVKKSVTGLFFVLAAVFAGIFLLRMAHAENETLTLAAEMTTLPDSGEEALAVTVTFNGRSVGAVSGKLVYDSEETQYFFAEGFGEEGFEFVSEDDGQAVTFVWGDAAEADSGSRLMVFYFSAAEGASFFLKEGSLTACRAENGKVIYFDLKPGNTIPENLVGKTVMTEAAYDEAARLVTVSWQEAEPAEGYLVYRRPAGGEWELIGETTELAFRDESPLFGQIAEYTAAAFRMDKDGNVLEGTREEPGRTVTIDGGPIEAVVLAETEIALVYGSGRPVPEVTYVPDYTSDEKRVVWSSSDEAILGVPEGEMQGRKPGKAVLTAAVPGRDVSAAADVRVLFTDVTDPGIWYFDSVYRALDENVTSGYGEGTFRPMAGLTRAQAAAFLYNLAGSPDVSGESEVSFTDVREEDWFFKAVTWAAANKITSGYGTGTFRPYASCTRAMIVGFLMNYAKLTGTYAEPAEESGFPDVPSTAWYKGAVDWAVANGVTSGYGDGTFRPEVTCNRAMMVTFLMKAAELPKVY